MKESNSPRIQLNETEANVLREKMRGPRFFLIIALILTGVGLFFLPKDLSLRIGIGVFCLFFLGVTVWWFGSLFLDLKNGFKLVVRGNVDDRIQHFFESGLRAQSIIFLAGKKYRIDIEHFANVTTGDYIELHYSPISSTSFRLVVLPKESVPLGHEQEKPSLFTATDPVTSPLLSSDKKVLWKMLRKRILVYLLALLFVIYLITGLIVSGAWVILVFMFPIPIIFITLIVIILKKVIRCNREINTGIKITTKTILIDKYQLHRTKRGGTRYILKTLTTEIYANETLYKQLKINDMIFVSLSTINEQLLGVQKDKGEYLSNF